MSDRESMLEHFRAWETSPVSKRLLELITAEVDQGFQQITRADDPMIIHRAQGALRAFEQVLGMTATIKQEIDALEDDHGS